MLAEQKLNETAAHIRALCVRHPNWNGAPGGLIGIDHSRLGASPCFDGVCLLYAKTSCARDERKRHSFEHRRTLYCFAVARSLRAPPQTTKNQNRIGLVNRNAFSIHHVANPARFSQQRLFSMKGA
ncbi:MAG: hypothetical protein ACJ8E2_03420 [Bradyrhizobium sp.]